MNAPPRGPQAPLTYSATKPLAKPRASAAKSKPVAATSDQLRNWVRGSWAYLLSSKKSNSENLPALSVMRSRGSGWLKCSGSSGSPGAVSWESAKVWRRNRRAK